MQHMAQCHQEIELLDHRTLRTESKYISTPHAGPSRITNDSSAFTQSTPVPSIVVTPAPPQEREMSSWVPIQDDCFGSRLTVPSHRALNSVHPPMIPTGIPALSVVSEWTYKRGHWWASTPNIDEQEKQGIYSRPRGMKRRTLGRTGGKDIALTRKSFIFRRSS